MAAEVAKKVSNVSEERTAEGRVADSENLRIEAADFVAVPEEANLGQPTRSSRFSPTHALTSLQRRGDRIQRSR